jgi:hypothetical protein
MAIIFTTHVKSPTFVWRREDNDGNRFCKHDVEPRPVPQSVLEKR